MAKIVITLANSAKWATNSAESISFPYHVIHEALSHLNRKKLERNARMTVLREGANRAGKVLLQILPIEEENLL